MLINSRIGSVIASNSNNPFRGLSGLRDIAARLERVENIAVVHFGDADIVRHPLVGEMLGVL